MPIIGSFGAGSGRGFGQTGLLASAPVGLHSGGQGPDALNTINRIELSTAGNATDFGDLTTATTGLSSGQVGDTTRAIVSAGGELVSPAPGYTNTIEYTTYATTGSGQDFGDLTLGRNGTSGLSSSTRGVFAGGSVPGEPPNTNVMDYITIASTGNALDFGDILATRAGLAGVSNSTRGVWGGAFESPGTFYNTIQYITIASTGNSTDFGDTLVATRFMGSGGNSTRGVFGGGQLGSAPYPGQNVIQYITIASTGNATDFGDLTSARSFLAGMSTKTTVVFSGGFAGPVASNTMDFVNTGTTGNATDFGDLTVASALGSATSSQHGGLQ